MKTYLVNFATDNFKKSQKKLNESALKFGVDKVFSFSSEDIKKTDFYKKNKIILEKKRGFGYWLWKPYFIYKTMSDGFIHSNTSRAITYIASQNVSNQTLSILNAIG